MLKRPCYRCGKPTIKNPCASCVNVAPAKPRQDRRRRPGPRQRGYNAEYEAARTHMIEQVRLYGAACYFCHEPLDPDGPISAEHLSPTRIVAVHPRCNSQDGGRRSRSGRQRLQDAR